MTESILTRLSSASFNHPVDLSPLQSQVDGLVSGFVHEATNPTTLAAITAGGMAYRLGRIGVMSLRVGAIGRSPLRVVSIAVGLGSEVTAFEFTTRLLHTIRATGQSPLPPNHNNLWNWSGAGGWREGLLNSLVTFGMLKGAGHLAREQNIILQHAFQSTAMVAGHQTAGLVGLTPRPEGSLAEQFLHAEVTNLQLGAGMGLLHSFAPGVLAFERGLDLSLRVRAYGNTPLQGQVNHWLPNFAPVEAAPSRERQSEIRPEEGRLPSSFAMSSIGEGGGGRTPTETVKRVIREVFDRGKPQEVEALRNIVLETLSTHQRSPFSPLLLERLQTRDPQQWRLALRFLVNETRFHPAFDGDPAFKTYVEDWDRRPHYKDIAEISLEFARDLRRGPSVLRELIPLRQALVEDPTLEGFSRFLTENQITPMEGEGGVVEYRNRLTGNHLIQLRQVDEEGVGTLWVGNWKHASVRVRFDAKGFFRTPIQAGNPLSIDSFRSYERPLFRGAAASKSATTVSPLEPRSGEGAKSWARRLKEFSQENPAVNSLRVVATLHDRLLNPSTKIFAGEVLRELEIQTQDVQEGKGILVRSKIVPGLKNPILLVSPPATFLPEAWSETFVEGIAKAFAADPTLVNRAIEVGSGTGFVSIDLSQLGAARHIIAVDKNIHAPMVGALNAAMNRVTNIQFREGDLLNGLKETADLILGCLPQMPPDKDPKNLSARELADYAQPTQAFEDSFGLGLLAGVINQAMGRLTPDGRVWLMMADRQGPILFEELFTRRGLHPRVLHTRFIHQDPGTEFKALAKIEEKTGFRFVFRRADGTPISATEALELPKDEIFHFLHFVEARPYRTLFQKSLEETLLGDSRWGYTEDPGTEHPALRIRVSEELSRDWGVAIDPEMVFLGPHPKALLEGLLKLSVSPGERVGVAGDFTPQDMHFLSQTGEFRFDLLGHDLSQIGDRVNSGAYSAVVLDLPRQIMSSSKGVTDLLQRAAEQNTRLIFVEAAPSLSDHRGRVLSRALVEHPEWMENVIVLQPLHERFHLREYPLSAALIGDSTLRQALMNYGDVTYSRVSSPLQEAYHRFLLRLERDSNQPSLPLAGSLKEQATSQDRLSTLGLSLMAPEIFHAGPKTHHPDPIDMSFGESEWKPPWDGQALLNSLALRVEPEIVDLQIRQIVSQYLLDSRGGSPQENHIVAGSGVQPLIVSALKALGGIQARPLEVLVPEPSYAISYPTVLAAGAELMRVETAAEDRFLLTPAKLSSLPRTPGRGRAILINESTNPAGQYYRPEEMAQLAQVALEQGAYLLMDEVFYLLNYQNTSASRNILPSILGEKYMTFGGLSKEFALGGIRFGFAATQNRPWAQMMRDNQASPPDPIALQAAQYYLPRYREIIPSHVKYLSERARALEGFFTSRGFTVPRVEGGYSLFVDLNPLFETPHSIEEAVMTRENLPDLLMTHAGIKIKSDSWAGVPGHYRFVFSIDRLPDALERLRLFFERVQ